MAVTFLPSSLANKIAPKKLVASLVTKDLTLNRTALQMLARQGILSKKQAEEVALRVIKQYKEKYRAELKDGASKTDALDTALNDKALMIQRIQNDVVHEIGKELKRTYRGEKYVWLPSDADVPDPLHQLNYGKRFTVGKGEMPGDRYGCKCGMRILVEEDELLLDDEIGIGA